MRYKQNTETRGSRKVVKIAKRGNKAKFDQIPYRFKTNIYFLIIKNKIIQNILIKTYKH